MSADRQTLPPARCPVLPGPQAEMETLRSLVNERLAAAVDDIVGVFVQTVARYREQIDLQRRQLDGLKEGEWSPAADAVQTSSWIKTCPEDPTPISAAQIKTEVGDLAAPESNCDFDPAAGGSDAAAAGGGLPAERSETDDSGEYWREATGRWRPEETEEAEARSPSPNAAAPPPPHPLSCKVCGESFQRVGYLITHASAHLRDCGLCGKHLDHAENLKQHLRVHKEASFRCAVCGQSFKLRGNLRTHMRIHSGERPYGCTVCGKSFGRRATLVRHVRSHTGEKPFTCSYCGRAFVEKGNLTVHLRTHTGEKPYWCSTCDRRFSQLSSFCKHPCQRRGATGE